MTLGSHQTSIGTSQDHITPKWLTNALGGPESFDLDPCSSLSQPWPCARKAFTIEDDGLSKSWRGYGSVFVNPPYDRRVVHLWVEKLAQHGRGILLTHCRTETAWFEPVWRHASGILFLADRIKFCRPNDGAEQPANSGAPAVLVAFGAEDLLRLRKSSIPGVLVTPPWEWISGPASSRAIGAACRPQILKFAEEEKTQMTTTPKPHVAEEEKTHMTTTPEPHIAGDVQSQPDPIEIAIKDVQSTPDPIEIAARPADDDPFDLSKLRLSQDFVETAGVKRLITTVPVRKPTPQEFVRVHGDPKYRAVLAIIELKDDREIYLVTPNIARELPGEFVSVMLFTAINRQGVTFLWPVKLPASNGRVMEWHRSAAEAAEIAMTRWVRVKSNMALGAYEIFEAASSVSNPEWPALSFQELLRVAFRDRLIDRFDHPVIKRLRGLA